MHGNSEKDFSSEIWWLGSGFWHLSVSFSPSRISNGCNDSVFRCDSRLLSAPTNELFFRKNQSVGFGQILFFSVTK